MNKQRNSGDFRVHQRSCAVGLGFMFTLPSKENGLHAKWENLLLHGAKDNLQLAVLARKGIPDDIRSEIWRWLLEVEAEKKLNEGAYERSLKKGLNEELKHVIDYDVLRTFPADGRFRKGNKLHETLRNILHAFAAYDPNIGYTQSMNYVAGLLVMQMDTAEDAFWMLERLCHHPKFQLSRLFTPDFPLLQEIVFVFEHLVRRHLKDLHKRFKKLEEVVDMPQSVLSMLVPKLVFPLFTSCLPLPLATRIWDALLTEGLIFIYKMGLFVFSRIDRWRRNGWNRERNNDEMLDIMRDLRGVDSIFSKPDKVIAEAHRMPPDVKELSQLINLFKKEGIQRKWSGFSVQNARMVRVESFPSVRNLTQDLPTGLQISLEDKEKKIDSKRKPVSSSDSLFPTSSTKLSFRKPINSMPKTPSSPLPPRHPSRLKPVPRRKSKVLVEKLTRPKSYSTLKDLSKVKTGLSWRKSTLKENMFLSDLMPRYGMGQISEGSPSSMTNRSRRRGSDLDSEETDSPPDEMEIIIFESLQSTGVSLLPAEPPKEETLQTANLEDKSSRYRNLSSKQEERDAILDRLISSSAHQNGHIRRRQRERL
mmetsp:Transcript_8893/g.13278  ORF Transcript_8893/g.13278 Transcript_8893/m.13278 type:complete len:591 (+) Transcript_8893:2-1774(+)